MHSAAWVQRAGTQLTRRLAGVDREKLEAFALMALCARARVGAGVAPLAGAYFAANLRREKVFPALLMGCAAGAFCTGVEPAALFAPASCALVLIFHLAWDALARHFPAMEGDAATRVSLMAGISVLLPALAAAGYAPGKWLGSLLAGAAAAFGALNLGFAPPKTQRATEYAAFSCAGVAAAAALGLPAEIPAVFCAVSAGAAKRGALAGVLLGALTALTGGGAEDFVLLSAMGAASDAAAPGKRGRLLGPGLAVAVWGGLRLWLGAAISPWAPAAAAAAALWPESAREAMQRAFLRQPREQWRQRQEAGRRVGEKLAALSEAFDTLSRACGGEDPAFGEQQLITRMRSALCTGCREYPRCWPGSDSSAVKLFCQLMTAAIEGGGAPFEDGQVPPDVMRLCRRGMTVPARLGNLLNDFAASRHRRLRLMESRQLLAGQFRRAAELLSAAAGEQMHPAVCLEGDAQRVRQALQQEGLAPGEVTALRWERTEISVELGREWGPGEAGQYARVISRGLMRPFVPDRVQGCRAVFVPRCALRAEAAVSTLPASPDNPSGDRALVRSLDSGHLLALLSDGMGSGAAAAEESGQVVGLLQALMRAGIDRELAVDTVNGVMLARGGEEVFATADMLLIDLARGRAEFTKLSASRSYILRGGRVLTVEGGKLPLGILEKVEPGLAEVKIRAGDAIYMTSDGVSDVLTEEEMEQVMLSQKDAPPHARAEALINAAALRAGERRDDMTAVCAMIS